MRHALITGGMGFIGNHLAHRLLSMGVDVTILDKSIHTPIFCDIKGANIVEGDVLSRELLYRLLMKSDVCFHLAALSSVDVCGRDWIFSHENNVLAFNGLIDSLRHLPHSVKLIYASSAAVYGNNATLPAVESLHVIPASPYGADKLSNELYATVAHQYWGLPSIGLRFFNVYGPGQLASNPYSGVISCFKEAIANERPLLIYGDGKQTRDFIYVEDVIDACLLGAKSAKEVSGVFNVCRGRAISIHDLATMMLSLSQKNLTLEKKKEKTGDIRHSLGDPTLAKKELGFTANTSMEEGLSHFLEISRETPRP